MVINARAPNDKYFTSLTFYDQAGYILSKADIYISNTTWALNQDGTVTVSINCGEDAMNNVDTAGQSYQYISRQYGASKAVIDGDIEFTMPMKK
jgi:hypothetical protein